MYNFEDLLEQALQGIMNFYGCDNPLEALIEYCRDYEAGIRQEILENGGTEEDVQIALEEEYDEIELGRMADPEIAMVYNKYEVLIKNFPPDEE